MSVPFLPTYWYLLWEWQLCKLLSSNPSAPNSPFYCLPGGSGLGLLLPVRLCQEGMLDGGGKAGEGRRELPFLFAFLFASYLSVPPQPRFFILAAVARSSSSN